MTKITPSRPRNNFHRHRRVSPTIQNRNKVPFSRASQFTIFQKMVAIFFTSQIKKIYLLQALRISLNFLHVHYTLAQTQSHKRVKLSKVKKIVKFSQSNATQSHPGYEGGQMKLSKKSAGTIKAAGITFLACGGQLYASKQHFHKKVRQSPPPIRAEGSSRPAAVHVHRRRRSREHDVQSVTSRTRHRQPNVNLPPTPTHTYTHISRLYPSLSSFPFMRDSFPFTIRLYDLPPPLSPVSRHNSRFPSQSNRLV